MVNKVKEPVGEARFKWSMRWKISLLENNFTLLRHSTTQQTQIKHVQSGENKLQPTPTDAE